MRTQVTELPDSRARVEVEVDASDVDKKIERAARGLAGEIRIPGFRKGKVPPAVVVQRIGREAVLEQAMRESLPEWYERALLDSGISPVGDPKLEVTAMPGEGEPLGFSIEVGVRPVAKLGDYTGLEVGRAVAEVPAEAIDAELDRLREGSARLDTVERPAGEGDFLLVDFRGEIGGEPFEGGEAHDYLLELGGGQLVPGFEEGLSGATAGEERDVEVSFPPDYRPERLAGQDATFHVTVKEVREKILPDLDDDFAAEASEFDSLEELRQDIREKLAEAFERQADAAFREAAVDAAVEQARVEVPEDIVAARAEERWERVERGLSARGMNPESYLRVQGKTRSEVIDEARPDAERELKREAVLAAVADAEQIQVTDQELLEALAHSAEHESTTPQKLLERLRSAGRDALLREDLRMRKAVDVIAESAQPIPVEQAEARERIWTPEKERTAAGEGGLWTPGESD